MLCADVSILANGLPFISRKIPSLTRGFFDFYCGRNNVRMWCLRLKKQPGRNVFFIGSFRRADSIFRSEAALTSRFHCRHNKAKAPGYSSGFCFWTPLKRSEIFFPRVAISSVDIVARLKNLVMIS